MTLRRAAESPLSSSPTLRLRMLVPRRTDRPFPFDQRSVTYYYLARNGIYALARAWSLAGRDVLVPAYCHGVEMQALMAAGARLQYYPVHRDMTVRAEDVIDRVTPRTSAVYLIHYLGFPGPVEELAAFCGDRDLPLIEDCALALLSASRGAYLGSFGDAAVFCLYKTLPLPNGGAIVVREGRPGPTGDVSRPSLASTLSYAVSAARRQGPAAPAGREGSHAGTRWLTRERVKPLMEKLGMVRVATEEFDLAHARLGMSALCHGIISAQHFAAIAARRRRNYLHLLSRLGGVARLVFPALPDGVCPLFFPVQTPHKRALRARLAERGIDSVDFWCAHAPGVGPGEYPDVDELRSTVLELPCHQDLTPDAMDRVADEVVALRAYL